MLAARLPVANERIDAVKDVVRETRALFQALRALADATHAGLGVNASMRAIMEFLAQNGPQTVPGIAKAKTVSRQHVQTIADELVQRGLAELLPNPQHKRSSLAALTKDGEAVFRAMSQREAGLFEELAAGASASGLEDLALGLAQLRARTLALLAQHSAENIECGDDT
jgi:DNA-binding MarR family transcriptional regulator